MIREARPVDLDAIEKIYDNIHAAEESGKAKIGWISGIYPVRATAEEAIRRRDMFVFEENGQILAARDNQQNPGRCVQGRKLELRGRG